MNTTDTKITSLKGLIKELKNGKGCRFVSMIYTSKKTNEKAIHLLAMGVNLERAYRRDVKILKGLKVESDLDKKAKEAVLASVEKSLEVGIGNNPAYTNQGVYEFVQPGIKLHIENNELHIQGFTLGKTVLEKGVYKEVNSSAMTLAKKAISKHRKMGKFRQFVIKNIDGARLNGKTLEIQ